ncbi:glycogen/starch synthase [uncultured Brachyspira sp.]|uniref:glycogen synthase n=1 Tax=uncultured Brachyspira sp. TaxID=221953 RepID=UPI002630181E|nr:glycogen/starch synthase [uncultured Brachyspira sp.]
MNIFTASSEAYPFSKTGGLGDIAGSLPLALDTIKTGSSKINTSLIVPLYKQNYSLINKSDILTKIDIEQGNDVIETEIARIKHPENSNVYVYFVKQDKFFKRNGIYSENGIDYDDNAGRFILFSKAIVKLIIYLYEKENLKLDIIHIHDWQTALTAIYIKEVYNNEEALKDLKVMFTIHNLAYQGNFNTNIYPLLNISWKFFVHNRLEFYGHVSFIKAGIILSDIVTTVSPSYSKEIQGEEFGCGMNSLLADISHKLYGVLNGVYDDSWNPKTDKYIKNNYDINSSEKKKLIRNSLYKELGFINKTYPLVTMISRFDPQKGLDLIYASFFELSTYDANFIFLFGKNNYFKDFENEFTARAKRAKNIKILFTFDESLAHRLTAGSDLYLMPSRFEPCGLNQIYSMKYGSLPIVHAVGGLKDTVINYSGNKSINKATGFTFNEYSVKSFVDSMDLAFDLYYNKRDIWNKLIFNAMSKDYSIHKTALEYLKLYKKMLSNKK